MNKVNRHHLPCRVSKEWLNIDGDCNVGDNIFEHIKKYYCDMIEDGDILTKCLRFWKRHQGFALGDGNCFFRSIAQSIPSSLDLTHCNLRSIASTVAASPEGQALISQWPGSCTEYCADPLEYPSKLGANGYFAGPLDIALLVVGLAKKLNNHVRVIVFDRRAQGGKSYLQCYDRSMYFLNNMQTARSGGGGISLSHTIAPDEVLCTDFVVYLQNQHFTPLPLLSGVFY